MRVWIIGLLSWFWVVWGTGRLLGEEPPVPAPVLPAPKDGVLLVQPAPPPDPKIWCGSIELGVNGTEGNSQFFKFRFGGNLKRATETSITQFEFLYGIAENNNVRSENRFFGTGRHEWLFRDSPWSLFLSGSAEYDEFKAFDVRLASHAGAAYTWLKTDRWLLKSRVGAGASREIGGPSNAFVPEGLIGGDLEWKIDDRSKIASNFDYFPNVTDWSDYRAQIRIAYELLLLPEYNITLKTGILDLYDSTPEGRKPNDLEYFFVLLWKF